MKVTICFFILIVSTCNKLDQPAPIILKSASFLKLDMSIESSDRDEIYAKLSIRNNSSDSILLYKPLFPYTGEIKYPIFSIFSSKNYEDVPYLGPRERIYEKHSELGDEIIIPKDRLAKENFFVLYSNDSMSFRINLSDVYSFEKFKSGDEFKITPTIEMPYVSFKYQQVFETDSADGISKPVFYHISLPKKNNVDSMRLSFKLSR